MAPPGPTSQAGIGSPVPVKEQPVQTLSTDPVHDTITITHVPEAPELIHADAGNELRWDDHDTDHHITVVKGTCRVLGRRLGAGGYVYAPAGVAHSVQAGAWGCTFFSVASNTTAI
jgi:quercetin dioxygenase-like cupin family protein